METKLLIIGKGDNVITMITDNLFSEGIKAKIDVFNNLGLEIQNDISHDNFEITDGLMTTIHATTATQKTVDGC